MPRKNAWFPNGFKSIFYAISAQDEVAIGAQQEWASQVPKRNAWFFICPKNIFYAISAQECAQEEVAIRAQENVAIGA